MFKYIPDTGGRLRAVIFYIAYICMNTFNRYNVKHVSDTGDGGFACGDHGAARAPSSLPLSSYMVPSTTLSAYVVAAYVVFDH